MIGLYGYEFLDVYFFEVEFFEVDAFEDFEAAAQMRTVSNIPWGEEMPMSKTLCSRTRLPMLCVSRVNLIP